MGGFLAGFMQWGIGGIIIAIVVGILYWIYKIEKKTKENELGIIQLIKICSCIDKLKEDIQDLKEKNIKTDGRLDNIDSKLEHLNKNFEGLTNNITIIMSDIKELIKFSGSNK